jgi:hypothetical protein
MKTKNVWDIDSIEDIEVPEIFMENAKMGIARIQFESLKVKELQKLNEKLDKLIAVMTPPINTKASSKVTPTKGEDQ